MPSPRRRKSLGQRGAVAAEFAIVCPILVSLLLCLCDLAPMISARYKTANATQSVADLTDQFANLQTTDVADLFAGGGAVLTPFSATNLVVRLTAVATDGKGKAFVLWSCGQSSSTLPPLVAKSTYTSLPTGGTLSSLLYVNTAAAANTALTIVESQYAYSSPAQYILKGQKTLTATAYGLPRVSAYIGFPWDGNPNDQPTAPTSTTKTATVTLSNGAVCNYAY